MPVIDPTTTASTDATDTGVYAGDNLVAVATGIPAYPYQMIAAVASNDASHVVVNGTATQLLALNALYTETSTPTEAQLIELATANGAAAGNSFIYDTEDGSTIYREVKTLGAGITLVSKPDDYWNYTLDNLTTLDVDKFTSGQKVKLFLSDGSEKWYVVDAATNGGKSFMVGGVSSVISVSQSIPVFDAGGVAKAAVPAALEAAHPAATDGLWAKRRVTNIDPASVPANELVSNVFQVLMKSDGTNAALEWIEVV